MKINLGLNVLGLRTDGYHDIETLFYPDDSCRDILEIVPAEERSETAERLLAKYGGGEDGEADGTASGQLFSSPAENEETRAERQPARYGGCDRNGGGEADGTASGTAPRYVHALSSDGKVEITLAGDGGISWNPLEDLCVKAYRLLEADFRLPAVRIFLEKQIPAGAGLGGGSADGAFTLLMLNEICSLGLSREQLASYAARLGSDCAFFLYNRPMLGEGRGERLTPFDVTLDGYEVRLVFPGNLRISTAEAYRLLHSTADSRPPAVDSPGTETVSLHSTAGSLPPVSPPLRSMANPLAPAVPPRSAMKDTLPPADGSLRTAATSLPASDNSFRQTANPPPAAADSPGTETVSLHSTAGSLPAVSPPLRAALARPVEEWKDLLQNSFEAPIFGLHPELAAIKQSLYDSGAVYASLSGSGPALFAIYKA